MTGGGYFLGIHLILSGQIIFLLKIYHKVTNPDTGYFQNCNANPFLATGFRKDISSFGINETAGIEYHQTNRSLRAIRLYGNDSSITREEFYNYKFDNQYEKNSVMAYAIDRFIEDFKSQDLELLTQLSLLKIGIYVLI